MTDSAGSKHAMGAFSRHGRPLPESIRLPDWRSVTLPDDVRRATTMLIPAELQLLHGLARDHFRNEGAIVDAGCFLGGSTLALASGVRANPYFQAAPRLGVIHSYDRFAVEPWTIGRYFPEDTPAAASFEARFRENIAQYADLITVHPGDVTHARVPDEPIEILFIDLAKHWKVNDYVVRAFFPRLVPGHSVVIQQDYLFREWNGWLPVTMEYFSEFFEPVDHTEINSVAFLYVRAAPPEAFTRNVIENLSRTEMRLLADRAIARFGPAQQKALRESQNHFEALLQKANWPE